MVAACFVNMGLGMQTYWFIIVGLPRRARALQMLFCHYRVRVKVTTGLLRKASTLVVTCTLVVITELHRTAHTLAWYWRVQLKPDREPN